MEWKQWEGHVIDGHFRLHEYVGGSAHSAVFLTEYGTQTPQKAVIKLVPADSAKAQTWMLRRELAAGLSHPGLLSLIQCGACQHEGTFLAYAVMEQSEEDLSQVIPVRPLAPAEVREVLEAVLEALGYIHREGFVHGCLTPANILATGDRIKISSDGLLRIGESSDDLWGRNVNGPPEGRAGMTPAGDVWSLGMLLVEAFTQRPPAWDGNAATDPVVPEKLEAPFFDIARRCLRCDPRRRCSLEDIALTLRPPAASPQPSPAVVAFKPIAKPAAPQAAGKRLFLWAAAAGVLVGGLIVSGLVLTRARVAPPVPAVEPQPSVPSEPVVVEKKPAPFPAPRAAVSAPPPSATVPSEAPAPMTQPAEPAPAAEVSAAKFPAGDVVDRVVPEVPPEILATIRGLLTVRVRVRVDVSGSVVDAELVSQPGSKYFDRKALEAARRWKFQPPTAAGSGTESTRSLRFECRRDGCQAFSGPVQP
ncbi:MAG: serine/threonine protein kinase [Bryobacteraceae bacterium]